MGCVLVVLQESVHLVDYEKEEICYNVGDSKAVVFTSIYKRRSTGKVPSEEISQ